MDVDVRPENLTLKVKLYYYLWVQLPENLIFKVKFLINFLRNLKFFVKFWRRSSLQTQLPRPRINTAPSTHIDAAPSQLPVAAAGPGAAPLMQLPWRLKI
jgi:hypothetical protein